MSLAQIKLQDLVRAGQTSLAVSEPFVYEDLPVTGPVQVKAYLQVTDVGATVKGQLWATLEEPCDRCLEPYRRDISPRFLDRYVYASLADHPASKEVELAGDDFYDTIGPDGILDLEDLVRQHIILAMTTDRICGQSDCKMDSDGAG